MIRMLLPKRHIRRLSASLIAVLLLTQLATAVFACTVEQASQETASMQPMADMPGCPKMASAPAPLAMDVSLCHAHCDQGSQVVSPSLGLDLLAFASVHSGFRVSSDLVPDLSASFDRRVVLASPTTGWPPPYLAFLVLRN